MLADPGGELEGGVMVRGRYGDQPTDHPLRVLHVKASVDREMGGSVTAIAGVARTTALAGDDATILSLTRAGDDLSVVERERDLHGVHLVLLERGRVAPFGFS